MDKNDYQKTQGTARITEGTFSNLLRNEFQRRPLVCKSIKGLNENIVSTAATLRLRVFPKTTSCLIALWT